jgi:SAM-dependent methyltransferase
LLKTFAAVSVEAFIDSNSPASAIMARRSSGHWTQKLFVEKPYLFLPFLEERKKAGIKEAAAVARLLRKHGVRSGSRILDLCCGIGRMAVPLAKQGYDVVGVDMSPDYVRRARRYAASKNVTRRTKFIVGDYRDIESAISNEKPFRGILSAFTSMGYYGKDADRRTFEVLARHTARGGVFILDTTNRDWILRHFQKRGYEMAGNVLVLEDREFDAERSYMVNRWEYYRIVGPHLRPEGVFKVDHRIYGPADLKELLESAGWAVVSSSADYDGNRIDITAPEKSQIVTVAKRR